MKRVLVLILLVLLVAIVLPMGMEDMGDCPMCTSSRTIVLGMCAGILSLFILIVLLAASHLRLDDQRCRLVLMSRSIYRPPRVV